MLAQVHLMRGKKEPALQAALEAEELLAECDEDQTERDFVGSGRARLLEDSNNGMPGWLAAQSSAGPKPLCLPMGPPLALRAHAAILAAEVHSMFKTEQGAAKAEEYARLALELARRAKDFTAEDRAIQLLE